MDNFSTQPRTTGTAAAPLSSPKLVTFNLPNKRATHRGKNGLGSIFAGVTSLAGVRAQVDDYRRHFICKGGNKFRRAKTALVPTRARAERGRQRTRKPTERRRFRAAAKGSRDSPPPYMIAGGLEGELRRGVEGGRERERETISSFFARGKAR